MKSKLLATLLALGSLALVSPLAAQNAAPKVKFPEASPPASLKQQIGITDIEISYNRPSMKGRKIFGGLVPYGEVWRTGANNAPRLTLSTPVKIEGTEIPAGTYELFTIPGENEWTIIVHQNKSQWGTYSYDKANDVARVTVKPQSTPRATETFAITFNDLTNDGATLNLYWENVRVPVKFTVDTVGMVVPQIEAALKEQAQPNPMFLFSAAMFYYENNLDLNKALEWMNAAIAARPGQMWMIYRKGLILAKMGDKAGAKAAAEESIALSEKAPSPALRDEYIRLNKALLESLK
jgi:hypothetical protein